MVGHTIHAITYPYPYISIIIMTYRIHAHRLYAPTHNHQHLCINMPSYLQFTSLHIFIMLLMLIPSSCFRQKVVGRCTTILFFLPRKHSQLTFYFISTVLGCSSVIYLPQAHGILLFISVFLNNIHVLISSMHTQIFL